jgi:uncharacterized iron-regulated protein
MLRLLLLIVGLTWTVPVLADSTPPWRDWQSTLHVESERAGTIRDTRAEAAIKPEGLIDRLAAARFVLIGEAHDNPDHHRLQAWIIARLAARGETSTVVMEMITRDKADALAAFLARPDAMAEALGPAVGWDKSGWPAWQYYQPIAEAALSAGLPIKAGNPSADDMKSVAREGFDSLGGGRRAELLLDRPLSDNLSEALSNELFEGHCRMLPRDRLQPMGRIQRLRDAAMADALVAQDEAVLIAGNGHVRADRGVPWYLRRRAPEADIAVVMLVELDGSAKAAKAYVERGPDGAPTADFIWLTPRAERSDPCEEMRRQMRKRRGDGD